MTPIKMFDAAAEVGELRDELLAAVDSVLRTGVLILGPAVRCFEDEMAATLGGGYAVGVASGTDALIVALLARGIGPGDEVITVANTAVATANAIQRVGATPVFCDVDPNTALLAIDGVEALLTERTRAIIVVHLFGNVVDVPALRALVGDRDIFILEDCAQAQGATLGDRPVGTFGHAAAFSFYPTKNLGALGDGGLCFTRDEVLAEAMRKARFYGVSKRNYAAGPGINSRLDELQAAILSVKLPMLARKLARRRTLAALYDRELPAQVRAISSTQGAEHARHLYVIEVEDRERVIEHLAKRDIETGVH